MWHLPADGQQLSRVGKGSGSDQALAMVRLVMNEIIRSCLSPRLTRVLELSIHITNHHIIFKVYLSIAVRF